MIQYEEACEKASKYFKENYEFEGIVSAYESEDYWIFYSGFANVRMYGRPTIAINKSNGNFEYLSMTDNSQAEILMNSKQIEVPKKYLIKKNFEG